MIEIDAEPIANGEHTLDIKRKRSQVAKDNVSAALGGLTSSSDDDNDLEHDLGSDGPTQQLCKDATHEYIHCGHASPRPEPSFEELLGHMGRAIAKQRATRTQQRANLYNQFLP